MSIVIIMLVMMVVMVVVVMVVMVIMVMMVVVVVVVVTSCLLNERPQLLGGDHAIAVSVKELESLSIFLENV